MDGETDEVRPKPRMRLRGWKGVRKGNLRGFAIVDLPNGLQISDVMVVLGKNGLFAQLPQRPVVRQGRVAVDESGKPLYDAPIFWQTGELRDRFSAAVIELVRERAPEDLDDPSPG